MHRLTHLLRLDATPDWWAHRRAPSRAHVPPTTLSPSLPLFPHGAVTTSTTILPLLMEKAVPSILQPPSPPVEDLACASPIPHSRRARGPGSAVRARPRLGSAARPQLGGVALARQCGVTPARLPGARPSTRPRAQSSAHGARSELGRRAARAALPSLPRGAVQCACGSGAARPAHGAPGEARRARSRPWCASSARSPGVAVAWCPARPWRATSAPGAVLARG